MFHRGCSTEVFFPQASGLSMAESEQLVPEAVGLVVLSMSMSLSMAAS
jgi:hypothetical protein